MWFVIIGLVIMFAIAIPIGISRGKATKQLFDEGKIIDRGLKFAEKGEEFTSKIGSMQALHDAMDKLELPCEMEGNTAKLVFKGNTYSAVLYRVAFDEPSGIAIYRFEFTSMQIRDVKYTEDVLMNYLMTAIEKMFLGLDPNTGVKSYELDLKTKHSLF